MRASASRASHSLRLLLLLAFLCPAAGAQAQTPVQPRGSDGQQVAPALPLVIPGYIQNLIAQTTRTHSGAVPSGDAAAFIGEIATVEGRVAAVESDGTRAIIAFTTRYSGRMKVLIYRADWPKFPQLAAGSWKDKFVQVKGALLDLDGPAIVLSDPANIAEVPAPTVPLALPGPPVVAPALPSSVPRWLQTQMAQVSPVHNGVVRVADAGIYLGQVTTVEGKVIAIDNNPGFVTLVFTRPVSGNMKIVIYRDDLNKFPASLGEALSRDYAQVSGPIIDWDGPTIVLRDPSNLRTLPVPTVSDEEALASQLTRPKEPVLPTSPPASLLYQVSLVTQRHEGIVPADEAALAIGQVATVEGRVVEAQSDGASIELAFEQNPSGRFKVWIYRDDWGKFPGPPEALYKRKVVRVTGAIIALDGPTMVVRDPQAMQSA